MKVQLGAKARAESAAEGAFRKFWLIHPLKWLKMLEKGSKIFGPSAWLSERARCVFGPSISHMPKKLNSATWRPASHADSFVRRV